MAQKSHRYILLRCVYESERWEAGKCSCVLNFFKFYPLIEMKIRFCFPFPFHIFFNHLQICMMMGWILSGMEEDATIFDGNERRSIFSITRNLKSDEKIIKFSLNNFFIEICYVHTLCSFSMLVQYTYFSQIWLTSSDILRFFDKAHVSDPFVTFATYYQI